MSAPRVKMGFGCIDLTRENNKIIDFVIEKGITYFDTSDCYGNNESELALGEKLKTYTSEQRATLTICTKVGVQFKPEGIHLDASPKYIEASCAASLKRLQTDYIDLYYLHRVDPNTRFEDSIRALKRLVDEKKVRSIGLSEVTADQIKRAYKIHPITAVQIEYSPWSRDDETNDVIKTCQELKIDVVAYSPLGRSFFTTNSTAHFESMPSTDFRRLLPRYTGSNLVSNSEAKKSLEKYAKEKEISLAQLVLAWEMAKGFIPIPATTNIRHFEENILSLQVTLSSEDVCKIDSLIDKLKFSGTRYPGRHISAIHPEKKEYKSPSKAIVLGAMSILAVGLFARILTTPSSSSSRSPIIRHAR